MPMVIRYNLFYTGLACFGLSVPVRVHGCGISCYSCCFLGTRDVFRMINAKQLRELVVEPTLEYLDPEVPYSEDAVELLIYEHGFQPIPNTEGYLVNSKGRVYSTITNKFLKELKGTRYNYYRLKSEGKLRTFTTHRILAEIFVDNPENKPCVNHKDGNKLNNNINNLEWVTHQENCIHSVETGLSGRGELNGNSYFTEDEVRFVKLWNLLGYSKAEIARAFNSTHSCISDITKERTWSHVCL